MRQELTISQLDAEFIELLPERETLSQGNFNWASVYANNSSMALNAASFHSTAASTAVQNISISQS